LQIHFRQCGPSLRQWSSDEVEDGRSHGRQGWARASARCGFEPTILEEGVSDHRHERMSIFSRGPMFVDEPDLIPGQMLLALVPDPLRLSAGNSHAHFELPRGS
jgi:hypothetical protein